MARIPAGEQPIETHGLPYGQNKAMEDAKRAVAMADRSPRPVSRSTSPQGATVQRPDVFGPTQRPNEPITAGAALGAGPGNVSMIHGDPAALAHAVYQLHPSPGLGRILRRMR